MTARVTLLLAIGALAGCFDFDRIVAHDLGGDAKDDLATAACVAPPTVGSWKSEQGAGSLYVNGFLDGESVLAVGSGSLVLEESATHAWDPLVLASPPNITYDGVGRLADGSLVLQGIEGTTTTLVRIDRMGPSPYAVTKDAMVASDLSATNQMSVAGSTAYIVSDQRVSKPSQAGTVGIFPVVDGKFSPGTLVSYATGNQLRGVVSTPAGVFVCGYGFFGRLDEQTQKLDISPPPPVTGGAAYSCWSLASVTLDGKTTIWALLSAPSPGKVCRWEVGSAAWQCFAPGIDLSSGGSIAVSPCDANIVAAVTAAGAMTSSFDGATFARDTGLDSITAGRQLLSVLVSRAGTIYAGGTAGLLAARR